jgi:hypothetical protein
VPFFPAKQGVEILRQCGVESTPSRGLRIPEMKRSFCAFDKKDLEKSGSSGIFATG